MNTAEVEKEVSPPEPLLTRAARLTSGMLLQDGSWALTIYALLVIPSLIAFWKDSFTLQEGIWLQGFERCVQLVVLYQVGKRWVDRLQQPAAKARPSSFPLLFVIGFVLWALLPFAALLYSLGTPLTQMVSPLLAIPAVLFGYLYYFYFFPVVLGSRSLRDIHHSALRFIRTDRLLPLKAMLGPLALMLLVLNALTIFSPDGQLLWVGFLRACASGLFFLLSTYLAYAIGFLLLGNLEWRQLEMDPYREARFSTIELQGASFLAKVLEPKNGLKVLLVAILIGLGNMAIEASRPPSATFQVEQIKLTDANVTLQLTVRDPEHNFRSFLPVLLSIAGPEGQAVTSERQPATVLLNGEPYDPLKTRIPEDAHEIAVTLTFNTTRTAENMKSLEDLYLWHRSAKITLLPMQDAIIEETVTAEEPAAGATETDAVGETNPATPESAS